MSHGIPQTVLPTVDTAANIASAASSINTQGKYAGKAVFDSTNVRMMFATGSAATSPWIGFNGTANSSVTPS